ncbi:protein of unknown function [Pilibacter termitis]|uniref:GTP cyclohydrolase n=1 Tax=Pilibacter termitis TaxID=263852 RepID=A0A1T4Q4M6_9ENTE|nr:DUF960 domain-containing protein [Pilibacter termitis]SJZ98481.1 protein of unknown function [Pilibacter termitis]
MKNFSINRNRFASFGVVSSLPGEIIDSIWVVIDMNLQGVVELDELITFQLLNHDGRLTLHFSQKDKRMEVAVDLPFEYSYDFPKEVYAYDDGRNETILLPTEINQRNKS